MRQEKYLAACELQYQSSQREYRVRKPEEKTDMSAGDVMIEAIAAAIAIKLELMVSTSQRLMDIEEAAKYLGMTPHALRHKAAVDIPCVRIDTKLRFDRRDLDRYIDRAKREGV
jgi:hypothetical protein